MSAGTSEFFCLICFLVCSCTAQEIITADVGRDVILPCKAPNKYNIKNTLVEWSRPELQRDYVLRYRKGKSDPGSQHPSYQKRVDLQDKEMKDGDVSLILKNVKLFDNGKYKCRVFEEGKNESISSINLEVRLPDNSWKTSTIVGLAVGLGLGWAAVTILLIVLCVRRRRQNRKKKKENQEELERLKRNHLEIKDQLQQEKQKTETLKTLLEEVQDEKLKLMKTGRQLRIAIQNQIQKLEKLQDEKQKLMETVGNLKTELQKMNQELELTGPITVKEFHRNGNYIRLKNISSEEINLEGWKLEVQRNNREEDMYTFNESVKLQAGEILCIRDPGWPSKHPDADDLEWSNMMKWSPGDKLQINLTSNDGETFKLL